jgi:hypothetical protein
VSVDKLCKSGKADLQLFVKVCQSCDSGGSSIQGVHQRFVSHVIVHPGVRQTGSGSGEVSIMS